MLSTKLDVSALKAHALALGFDDIGICPATEPPHYAEYLQWLSKGWHGSMEYLQRQAPLKRHPQELLPGARSIIAVALNYNQPNPEREGHAKIARYALGRDYHKVLRSKLRRLASYISLQEPHARTRACVDSAPIMERDFAQMAGLGWFGKNTMLINSKRGSWFFIGLLITDLELPYDQPSAGGCGTCRACIEACPTGALVFQEGRWQVNARSCISYLTIEHAGEIDPSLAELMSGWTFGCDVCQEVCPFNQPRASQPYRALPTREVDFRARDLPDLIRLSELSYEEWDHLTQGSPLRRTGHAGLRRNARIALERLDGVRQDVD